MGIYLTHKIFFPMSIPTLKDVLSNDANFRWRLLRPSMQHNIS